MVWDRLDEVAISVGLLGVAGLGLWLGQAEASLAAIAAVIAISRVDQAKNGAKEGG